MLRNLALALASLGLLAGVLECAARLIYPAPPTWLEPQTRHLESPLLGWVLPPGSRSYTIDAPVRVNALGLRDDELPRRKPPGETRILCLGDSFTFALGVRFEDLYVQQLERLLAERNPGRAFQVINAGVAGYNTRQELIYLLAEGLALEPDLVVVAFYWNDLIGNEPPLPDLERTPRLRDDAVPRGPAEHTLPRVLRDRLRQSVLLYQLVTRTKLLLASLDPAQDPTARVQRGLLAGDGEAVRPYLESTGRRLRQIAETARAHGAGALLVHFPMENQIRGDRPNWLGRELPRVWAPTGMPFVDLDPLYRAALAEGENPFLPYDLHPSAVGMRIAARAIHDTIVSRGWLGLGTDAVE